LLNITKGIITSAVISLISGLAFATGFLKEGVANEIEETKITIAYDETLVERIDDKIDDVLISDHLSLLEATDEIAEAKHLVQLWELTYDNSTQLERAIYLGELETKVNRYEKLVRDSYIGDMIHDFKVLGLEDDYFLATSSFDGFNYTISKQKFDNYDGNYSLAEIMPLEDFLESFLFKNASDIASRWLFHLNGDRTRVGRLDHWANMFRNELYIIHQQLNIYTMILLLWKVSLVIITSE